MIGSRKITCNHKEVWSPSQPEFQINASQYNNNTLQFNVLSLGVYCPNLHYDKTRLSMNVKKSKQATSCSTQKYCIGDIITFSPLLGYYLTGGSHLACLQQKPIYESRGNWNVSHTPQALGIRYTFKLFLVLNNRLQKEFWYYHQ